MKTFIIGGGIAIAVIAYFLARKKTKMVTSSGYCKLTKVHRDDELPESKSATTEIADSPADKFFCDAIDKYKEKLLANCILNIAENAGFNAEQRLKLTKKYGLVSLVPMLTTEISGFKDAGLRYGDIEKSAKKWLKRNYEVSDGVDAFDSIEMVLKKMMQQKAEDIINSFSH